MLSRNSWELKSPSTKQIAAALAAAAAAYAGYRYMQSPSASVPEAASEQAIERGVCSRLPEISIPETLVLFKRSNMKYQNLLNHPVSLGRLEGAAYHDIGTSILASPSLRNDPNFLPGLEAKGGLYSISTLNDEQLGIRASFRMLCISQAGLPDDSVQKIMVILRATIIRLAPELVERTRVIEVEDQFNSITTINGEQKIIQRTAIIMPRYQFLDELDRIR
jgi:hypothetical protein